jgi:hypothetical protein
LLQIKWLGFQTVEDGLELAKKSAAKVHDADPDIILQACVFEIVSRDVGNLPVPDWALAALGQPAEKRNFRYEAMVYASSRDRDQWGQGASVPDVSLNETKLWFYYLAASYIDAGCEAIHFGQAEIMNRNDRGLDHWAQVLGLVRSYAAKHARRHLVLCDAHVPSGGLARQGRLLSTPSRYGSRRWRNARKRASCEWGSSIASMAAVKGESLPAAGGAGICPTWWSWTTGA